jgi:tetratricopeptide (TPR) repeat protein
MTGWVAIGVAVAAIIVRGVWLYRASLTWPTADGVVTQLEVERRQDSNGHHFCATFSYDFYDTNGSRVSGTWFKNFSSENDAREFADLQKRRYDEAVAELKKAVFLSGDSPTCIANLARAYVASNNRGEAEKLLIDLKRRSNGAYSNAPEIAIIYASLGDADQAMNWLERGYEERFNPGVLLRQGFDPIRSDPRFRNLVHRIGLPD